MIPRFSVRTNTGDALAGPVEETELVPAARKQVEDAGTEVYAIGSCDGSAAMSRTCSYSGRLGVHTLRYNSSVAGGIEFDWDAGNIEHLAAHKVTAAEFEQVMLGDPLDLAYYLVGSEERYRSVGRTTRGRLLSVAWTIRHGKVRAVTAFPASVSDRKAFLERSL